MNDSSLVGFVIVGALVVAVLMRMAALEHRLHAVSRIDAKLDALLKHAGVKFDPYAEVAPSVVEALRHGQKIEAIKRYREATGVDLKQAKDYVEELLRRARARA